MIIVEKESKARYNREQAPQLEKKQTSRIPLIQK